MSFAELVLSPDQQHAVDEVDRFVLDPDRRELVLGGLAGTGKTTIVGRLLDRLPRVVAPTAKACAVLRRKGVIAKTIHSTIYDFAGVTQEEGQRPKMEFDDKDGVSLTGLVICDEASMVTTQVANSLRSCVFPHGGKILWVGDHGQLPPVGDDPRIMHEPDVRLERIHRQAEGSPILKVAHAARGGMRLSDAAAYDAVPGLVRGTTVSSDADLVALLATERPDVVLVARNDTRRRVNRLAYELLARSNAAVIPGTFPRLFVGAPLVALRNCHQVGIINGEQYVVERLGDFQGDEYRDVSLVDALGTRYDLPLWLPALGEGIDRQLAESSSVPYEVGMFDFSWALTVHKAQGSEWDSVLVLDEVVYGKKNWDHARWSYTAATRAKRKLVVARVQS